MIFEASKVGTVGSKLLVTEGVGGEIVRNKVATDFGHFQVGLVRIV
jgi:hypothetical protein